MARRGALLLCLVALGLVTGRAGEVGAGAVLLAWGLALVLAGCGPGPSPTGGDGGGRLDAPRVGGPDAATGYCTPCCGAFGDFGYCGTGTYSCWCPAGVSCNYAFGCIDTSRDAGSPGTWEPCCLAEDGGRIGTVSSCLCPGRVECGFAFVDCGDGRCAVGDGGVCPTDGGEVDADL